MKTAIMFSGQGAQTPGMMKDLLEAYPECRQVFDDAKEILGRDIYDLVMNASQETLNETTNTQPCVLLCELAALRIFKQLGIRYDAAVGFSLGEWAALVAAEVAAEADVVSIIEKRAAAMQKAVPLGAGGMAAILGKDEQFVRDFCQSIGDIAPANFNCAGNISVAGTAAAVEKFLEKATAEGLMTARIAISIPSHSVLMQPAVVELSPIIDAMKISSPAVDFVMNATGAAVHDGDEIKTNLKKQLANPVQFQQTLELLLNNGYDTFIEIGPGKVLSGFVKRTAKAEKKTVNILQLNCKDDISKIIELS